jgi:hypothetical protein
VPTLVENSELANFISHCLLEVRLSPGQITALIKSGNTPFPPEAAISRQTICSAVDKGYIPNVTRENMSIRKEATMFSGGQKVTVQCATPKTIENRGLTYTERPSINQNGRLFCVNFPL